MLLPRPLSFAAAPAAPAGVRTGAARCTTTDASSIRIARCSGPLRALGVVLLLHAVFPQSGTLPSERRLPTRLRALVQKARDCTCLNRRLHQNLVYVALATSHPKKPNIESPEKQPKKPNMESPTEIPTESLTESPTESPRIEKLTTVNPVKRFWSSLSRGTEETPQPHRSTCRPPAVVGAVEVFMPAYLERVTPRLSTEDALKVMIQMHGRE